MTEYQRKSIEVLENALATAPFYKNWRKYDLGSGANIDERYAALPELTKKDMRDSFPNGLVTNNLNITAALAANEIEYIPTSGTTEEKVVNIWNQKWWEAGERASWRLNANTLHMEYPQKEAEMASALSVGFLSDKDLPAKERIYGHTLYLNEKRSPILWQEHHFKRIADELNNYKPVIIEANPSYLAHFAFWAIDNDKAVFSPKAIIFTYELPSVIHLSAIRKVFSSPFISSFGSTETGFVMQQCECGLMHQNTDCCRIDFQPMASKYGEPFLGRMLVTTFDNPWAAIIRFDIGDLVRLHASPCKCGRNEGLIAKSIEGRTANITFTTRGGIVTSLNLDTELAAIPQIRDYHLEQQSPTQYELQIVICGDTTAASKKAHQILKDLYGHDGEYKIIVVPSIQPSPSGKYRRTQTNFHFNQKQLFE